MFGKLFGNLKDRWERFLWRAMLPVHYSRLQGLIDLIGEVAGEIDVVKGHERNHCSLIHEMARILNKQAECIAELEKRIKSLEDTALVHGQSIADLREKDWNRDTQALRNRFPLN